MATPIDKIHSLTIGMQGENISRTVQMDMSAWVEEFPDASFHVLFRRYNDSEPSPMVSEYTLEDKILTWIVTLSATTIAGVGYTEVRAIDPETGLIRKSRIIPTSVENSVSGIDTEDPPEPYTDWVNSVLAAKDSALASKSDSEAWAIGERNGVPVGQTDETYHNNAKFYCDAADQKLDDHSHGYIYFYIDEDTGRLIYNAVNEPDIDFEMDEGRLIALWQ